MRDVLHVFLWLFTLPKPGQAGSTQPWNPAALAALRRHVWARPRRLSLEERIDRAMTAGSMAVIVLGAVVVMLRNVGLWAGWWR